MGKENSSDRIAWQTLLTATGSPARRLPLTSRTCPALHFFVANSHGPILLGDRPLANWQWKKVRRPEDPGGCPGPLTAATALHSDCLVFQPLQEKPRLAGISSLQGDPSGTIRRLATLPGTPTDTCYYPPVDTMPVGESPFSPGTKTRSARRIKVPLIRLEQPR